MAHTTTQTTRRQRLDGTWTYTTEAWDAQWYWPEGTAVTVNGTPGVVVKQNSVSASVTLADGHTLKAVPLAMLGRRAS